MVFGMEEGRSKREDHWCKLLSQGGKRYKENVEAIKQILIENRGYVNEIPRDEFVILLFSGGMDSTILIDILIREWNCKLILLYFRRDSKNQKWEEQAVDYFFNYFKQKYPNNIMELLKIELQIPLRINKEYMNRERQKYFGLPMRNATMWTNAWAQAVYLSEKYKTTIRTVCVGSIKEDLTSVESGILSVFSGTLHVNICMGIWYYQIMAPYLDGSLDLIFDKTEIIHYAQKYNIPIENTRSCFEADEQPCGKCLACENRDKAFESIRK